jgi:hypothetical protein
LPATFPELVERIWSAAIDLLCLQNLNTATCARLLTMTLPNTHTHRSQNVEHKMCLVFLCLILLEHCYINILHFMCSPVCDLE